MSDNILYEKLIDQNDVQNYQVKVVISEFRGTTYLGIRKYFLSFDDGYVPSKEGISIPLEITSSFSLLEALLDICSEMEGIEAVKNKLESLKEMKYNSSIDDTKGS